VNGRSMPTHRAPAACAASLSVCLAAWLIAHSLAYRLVGSEQEGGAALAERPGHGELAFSPYLTAVSVTVLLLALAGAVAAGAAHRARPALPRTPFVVLPLLDFVSHVVVDSLHHGGAVPAGAALEPVLLLALALQVAFALAALLLARTALGWAERLGRDLMLRWRPRALAPASPAQPRLLSGTEHRPIIPALASGYAQRGPPHALPVR
jgi:hypothetical protein